MVKKTSHEARAMGKRSLFEVKVEEKLDQYPKYASFYEDTTIEYIEPAQKKKYIPDWTLEQLDRSGNPLENTNPIYLEAKGEFVAKDRKKLLTVKQNYASMGQDIDIRLVFQRDNWLTPKKIKRYSDWARENGFKYSIWPELPI